MAITATGYRNRLLEEAPALGIQVSKKQAEKIGIRIARRIESQVAACATSDASMMPAAMRPSTGLIP